MSGLKKKIFHETTCNGIFNLPIEIYATYSLFILENRYIRFRMIAGIPSETEICLLGYSCLFSRHILQNRNYLLNQSDNSDHNTHLCVPARNKLKLFSTMKSLFVDRISHRIATHIFVSRDNCRLSTRVLKKITCSMLLPFNQFELLSSTIQKA